MRRHSYQGLEVAVRLVVEKKTSLCNDREDDVWQQSSE